MNNKRAQRNFNLAVGELDRVLSLLVNYGRAVKHRRDNQIVGGEKRLTTPDMELMDEANQQTLKHHAEDMIAAANKILKDIGKEVQATPQP